MIRHWTVFEGRPNLADKRVLRVTLNKKKIFLLNKAAFQALGSPAAVELRFDEGTRTIGLRPRDPRRANAFPVRKKAEGKNGQGYSYHTICAAPFCTHFDIRPDCTMLFSKIDMDNEGTLLLEMSQAVKVGRGSR